VFGSLSLRSRVLIVAVLAVPLMAPVALAADPRELDTHERWMVGAINDARQAHGLPRLLVSRSLTRAAADYAEYQRVRRYWAHIDQEGRYPWQRAMAAGWPDASAREVLVKAPEGADVAFESWRSSPPHWQILMSPLVDHVGMARDAVAHYYWVGLVAGPCPQGQEAACEVTTDTGDSSIPLYPESSRSTRDPQLRVSIRRAGRRLIVRASARGSGRIDICIRRLRSRYCQAGRVRRHGAGIEEVVRATPGRWRARATYKGNSRWSSTRRSTRTVHILTRR
jgi:Cysteine-rich secretory protein family